MAATRSRQQASVIAEASFWNRVAELGAIAAEGAVYLSNKTPVALICPAGHSCSPLPNNVLSGHDPCRTCKGQDPIATQAAFWAQMTKIGATRAIDGIYKGGHIPVHVICPVGHSCHPRPSSVLHKGQGICRTCAGNDNVAAESAFWINVAAIGATAAEGAIYRNSNTPVSLICAQGHPCLTRPAGLQQGRGCCRTCAGNDTIAAETSFWISVARLGASSAVGAVYINSITPVNLICAQGHSCSPMPAGVQQGEGICRECAVSFNRVYLMHHPAGIIKVGIASGDARVKHHLRRGYQLVNTWHLSNHDAINRRTTNDRVVEVPRMAADRHSTEGRPHRDDVERTLSRDAGMVD